MVHRAHKSIGMHLAAASVLMVGVSLAAAQGRKPPEPPPPPIALPEPGKQVDLIERIEDPEQIRPVFGQLVAQLGSEKFTARRQATERLTANEQFTLEMMESALAGKGLSLEARHRLSSIARQRFYRTPRGALGFQFGDQLRDPVVVKETIPRFPAAKMLEPGDLIVVADGVKLEGPSGKSLLQVVIISHDPGEKLHLTIRRGAKKMVMDVPLGRFEDLGNGGVALIEDRLTRAWRFRVQSRMGGMGEPIRIAGATGSWISKLEDAQRKLDVAIRRDANDMPVRFAGGGMPRAAMGDEGHLFDQVTRPQLVVINGQVRVMNMPLFRNGMGGFNLDFDPDSGQMPIRAEDDLARLLDTKRALERQLGGIDPDALPEQDPRRVEKLDLKKRIAVITKQYDAIEAEHDEARAAASRPKPGASGTQDATAPPGP